MKIEKGIAVHCTTVEEVQALYQMIKNNYSSDLEATINAGWVILESDVCYVTNENERLSFVSTKCFPSNYSIIEFPQFADYAAENDNSKYEKGMQDALDVICRLKKMDAKEREKYFGSSENEDWTDILEQFSMGQIRELVSEYEKENVFNVGDEVTDFSHRGIVVGKFKPEYILWESLQLMSMEEFKKSLDAGYVKKTGRCFNSLADFMTQEIKK